MSKQKRPWWACTCNLNTREVEAGGFSVEASLGYTETLIQNKQNRRGMVREVGEASEIRKIEWRVWWGATTCVKHSL
jgi:hypothetical protein